MASNLSNARRDNPVVVVLGATGTGKSQLAVDLAKRFDGEIINGDAMQLYEGLPIITNKITVPEQQGIPHHLLGTIGLNEPTWVVSTFVKKALAVMHDIRARGRLPILVGGTHYYTQSLIFHDVLAEQDREHALVDSDSTDRHNIPLEEQWPLLAESTDVLLEKLRKVDPVMADRWHPKDRRKIQTSLRIYLESGERASELYARQQLKKQETMSQVGKSLMRCPTLMFWVHAESEALRTRLDARVDKMVESGLLDEVQQLHNHLQAESRNGHAIDESKGIWVSIGFKEFKSYMEALQLDASADVIGTARKEGLERTKISTRQYAKGQVRWIRHKLMRALHEAGLTTSLFLLDGTTTTTFNEAVAQPAIEVTECFLNSTPLPDPKSLSPTAAEVLSTAPETPAPDVNWSVKHCELCDVSCATKKQWEAHTNSKAHRKLLAKSEAGTRPGHGDEKKNSAYKESAG